MIDEVENSSWLQYGLQTALPKLVSMGIGYKITDKMLPNPNEGQLNKYNIGFVALFAAKLLSNYYSIDFFSLEQRTVEPYSSFLAANLDPFYQGVAIGVAKKICGRMRLQQLADEMLRRWQQQPVRIHEPVQRRVAHHRHVSTSSTRPA